MGLVQRFSTTALSSPHALPTRPISRIAVIGGGPSGVFASIAASEDTSTKVTIFEATSEPLKKVKISGGGRCNVLHDTSKTVPILLSGYPRGRKELNSLFHKRFTPTMAREWFESRGVQLKTESDGRMFPTTDSSQTIMDVLTSTAQSQGVELALKQKVVDIRPSVSEKAFEVALKDGSCHLYQAVILATGSSPSGYALAQSLGHPMETPVPSLFTFNAKNATKEFGLLHDLAGVSVPFARVSLSKNVYQEGPLLITHHGLSGPAVLRLSAFAARELHANNYRGPITIHWDTKLGTNQENLFEELWKVTTIHPKRAVASSCPLPNNSIPRRLWAALVAESGVELDTLWGAASKKAVRQIVRHIISCPIEVTGKGVFKEEFVTAGGVSLKGIDMTTMQSKIHQGLFFCGELIDIDGITGGFNFMNCWSTGFVAGHAAADLASRIRTRSSEYS